MSTYSDVFAETMRTWKADGIESATQYVESALDRANASDRGPILTLLAGCYKRQESWAKAEVCLREALDIALDARAKCDAFCEMLDLCISTHQVANGIRYGICLENIIGASSPDAEPFRAPYHHNMGRLLLVATDHTSALSHLKTAAQLFAAAGKTNEEMVVNVSIAKVLLHFRDFAGAETLCRTAITEATSAYVRIEANLVLEAISAAQGEFAQAERNIDRATKLYVDVVGKKDFRVFLDILLAEADLTARRGDAVTAQRITTLVQRRAAVGRISTGGEVTA